MLKLIFVDKKITPHLDKYPNADLLWCQEEPLNNGAWTYVAPRILTAANETQHHKGKYPQYAGRNPTSSVATGSKVRFFFVSIYNEVETYLTHIVLFRHNTRSKSRRSLTRLSVLRCIPSTTRLLQYIYFSLVCFRLLHVIKFSDANAAIIILSEFHLSQTNRVRVCYDCLLMMTCQMM